MVALIQPGFEALGGWSYLFAATREQTSNAHGGDWAAVIEHNGLQASFLTQNCGAPSVGKKYLFTLWARRRTGSAGITAYLSHESTDPAEYVTLTALGAVSWYDAEGDLIDTATVDPIGQYVQLAHVFTATDTADLELVIRTNAPNGTWWIDDCTVEDFDVAVTNAIYEALIDDLEAINGTGIFTSSVNGVFGEPVDVRRLPGPSITIRPASGAESDIEALTNLRGGTRQFYVLQLLVRSATPHSAVQTLLDDVRNACERSSSNLYGVSITGGAVENVTVSQWSEIMTSEDLRNQYGIMNCTVAVDYLYTRGGA